MARWVAEASLMIEEAVMLPALAGAVVSTSKRASSALAPNGAKTGGTAASIGCESEDPNHP